jgi:hypothetical protein
MIPVHPRRPAFAAAAFAIVLVSVAAPARAQGDPPGKATPQSVSPAPQATYAAPQTYGGGTYASPQANRPCTCYFPQGYCPFPRGNCVAVRPSPQQHFGSPQLDLSQPAYLAPSMQSH